MFLWLTLAVGFLANCAKSDVSSLFGSMALAGVSMQLQHAIRNIPPEQLQTLNCFSANRLGEYLQKVEETVNMGVQQQRYNSVAFRDDWDRLLLGFLEVSNLQLDTECRSTRISPRLCESVNLVVDHYIRQRLCGEVYDLEWIQSRCPEDIIPGLPSFSSNFRSPPPLINRPGNNYHSELNSHLFPEQYYPMPPPPTLLHVPPPLSPLTGLTSESDTNGHLIEITSTTPRPQPKSIIKKTISSTKKFVKNEERLKGNTPKKTESTVRSKEDYSDLSLKEFDMSFLTLLSDSDVNGH